MRLSQLIGELISMRDANPDKDPTVEVVDNYADGFVLDGVELTGDGNEVVFTISTGEGEDEEEEDEDDEDE